jgi:hypothetical protein
VAVPRTRVPLRCLFVLVAFEENGGGDVARAYQELGRPDGFLLWGAEQALPNPLPLGEYARSIPIARPERIQSLSHGVELQDTLTDDTWVGAEAASVELRQGQEALLHFHVFSPDRANDWTLRLCLRFA